MEIALQMTIAVYDKFYAWMEENNLFSITNSADDVTIHNVGNPTEVIAYWKNTTEAVVNRLREYFLESTEVPEDEFKLILKDGNNLGIFGVMKSECFNLRIIEVPQITYIGKEV